MNTTPLAVLKTIKVDSMSNIVESLNFNFQALVNNYVSKGPKGNDGLGGDLGAQGKRGASFMLLNLDNYAKYFVIPDADATKLTINDINTAIANNSGVFFAECLSLEDIVHSDKLVLPNGDVLSYNSLTGNFIDTYLKIYQYVDNLTEERVIQLIKQYSSAESGLYTTFDTFAKVVADDAPNAEYLNSSLTPQSAADIGTTDSGKGYVSKSLIFIALQETAGVFDNTQSSVMHISGHAKQYHRLFQDTIAASKKNSLPKIENAPVHTFIQNTAYAGLLLGSMESNTLDNFAHIRKSTDSLDIMPYYTNDGNTINNSTLLQMAMESILLQSNNIQLRYKNALTIANYTAGRQKQQVFVSINEIELNDKVKLTTLGEGASTKVLTLNSTNQITSQAIRTSGLLSESGGAIPTEYVIMNTIDSLLTQYFGWNHKQKTVAQYVAEQNQILSNNLTAYINQQIANITYATTTKPGLIRLADMSYFYEPTLAAMTAITPSVFDSRQATRSIIGTTKFHENENAVSVMASRKTPLNSFDWSANQSITLTDLNRPATIKDVISIIGNSRSTMHCIFTATTIRFDAIDFAYKDLTGTTTNNLTSTDPMGSITRVTTSDWNGKTDDCWKFSWNPALSLRYGHSYTVLYEWEYAGDRPNFSYNDTADYGWQLSNDIYHPVTMQKSANQVIFAIKEHARVRQALKLKIHIMIHDIKECEFWPGIKDYVNMIPG